MAGTAPAGPSIAADSRSAPLSAGSPALLRPPGEAAPGGPAAAPVANPAAEPIWYPRGQVVRCVADNLRGACGVHRGIHLIFGDRTR